MLLEELSTFRSEPVELLRVSLSALVVVQRDLLHDASVDQLLDVFVDGGVADAGVGLLEDAHDDLWVLPVLALHCTQSGDDEDSESQRRQGLKRMDLTYYKCDQNTTHQFHGTDDVPDEAWSGQPIWKCRVCGATRYSPAPDDTQ